MDRIAVLTSGGDAPGMNAALRAIAKAGAAQGVDVVGVEHGYDGLVEGRARPLTVRAGGRFATVDALDVAGGFGGTLLGSVRSARFRTPEGRAQAATWMRAEGLGGLIVVGGNGSLAGAHAFYEDTGVPVVGVPASIDNDIGCTSTALGVDTALNTILEAADRISDTARAHRRAFVMEVMGRQCGYLAMAAAVAASADGVLYPEAYDPASDIVAIVERAILRVFDTGTDQRRALIIKAEGVSYPTTRLVREVAPRVAAVLPGVEVRGVVLGHLVRGGAPSFQDRMIAARMGFAAVAALLEGHHDVMIAWRPHRPVGATIPSDLSVRRVDLAQVLTETASLLDGSAEVTRRRVAMMEAVEGVMPL
jgi:6-phosphofructokinase 1